MTSIAKGANLTVGASRVHATLSWTPGSGVPDIDGSALLLRDTGRVASDEDFVFYNQPVHPGGAAQHLGKQAGADAVAIDLASLGAEIDRVVLAASADGGSFGEVPGLRLVLTDAEDGADLAQFAVEGTGETAMVTGELYRRNGQWKFRAVGQGYASGLAGLAADFGISVDGGVTPTPPDPAAVIPEPAAINPEPAVAPPVPDAVVPEPAAAPPAPAVAPEPASPSPQPADSSPPPYRPDATTIYPPAPTDVYPSRTRT